VLFDVVRVPFRNVVIQADLVFHHKDLTDLLATGESDTQVYIKQAGEDVQQYLDAKGNRPFLVLNPAACRRAIEHRALELFFFAKSKSTEDRWYALYQAHQNSYHTELQALGPLLVYDYDESGTADGTSAYGKSGEEGSQNVGMRFRI